MPRFTKANAREMGRRGGAARKGVPTRATAAFREFAMGVLGDEKVRARILVEARAGRLPSGTINALIAIVAGKPGPAPAPPPAPEQVEEEALRARVAAYYESLSPEERRIATDLARARLGRPTSAQAKAAADAGAARRSAPPS